MFGYPREDAFGLRRRPANPLGPVAPLEDRAVPALFANPDFYTAEAGRVLTVPSTQGVLANDFSDTNTGQVLTATYVPNSAKFYTAAGTVVPNAPLPANVLIPNVNGDVISPDGSFAIAVPDDLRIPPDATSIKFNYTLANGGLDVPVIGTATITIGRQGRNFIAVGADVTGGPHVRVYEAGSADLVYNFFPYEESFRGGVRVAVGDVNADGVDDIATIPAAGGSARLRLFDGIDGAPILDVNVFDPAFRGGGYVTIGDFNGNGTNDVIVGAGEGGGPRVQVFELNALPGNPPIPTNANTVGLTILADFFAFDANTATGVRVAAGDLDGVGRDYIVATPGRGGVPEVRVFDGNQVLFRSIATPVRTFVGFDATSRTGLNIATGNFNGTGQADIIVGTGAGAGIVRIYDGRTGGVNREFRIPVDETATGGSSTTDTSLIPLFQTGATGSLLSPGLTPGSLIQAAPGTTQSTGVIQGGARVGAVDWDGDGIDDLLVGAGAGNAPRVRIIDTTGQTEFTSILAYSSTFLGGVNVAGG